MNETLAGLTLGSAQKVVTIQDVDSKRYDPNDKNDKIYIKAVSADGAPYVVSEIWLKNHRQEVVCKGLWIEYDPAGKVHRTSTIGRLFQYLGVSSFPELIGKDIIVEPKPNGYMAIVAYQ